MFDDLIKIINKKLIKFEQLSIRTFDTGSVTINYRVDKLSLKFLKMGQPWPLFRLFSVFSNKHHYNFVAAIAPWFRLRLPSCSPGFESQAHHLCF